MWAHIDPACTWPSLPGDRHVGDHHGHSFQPFREEADMDLVPSQMASFRRPPAVGSQPVAAKTLHGRTTLTGMVPWYGRRS